MVGSMFADVSPPTVVSYQIGDPNVLLASADFGAYSTLPRGIVINPTGSAAFVISQSYPTPGPLFFNIVPLQAAPPLGVPGPPTGVNASAGVGSAIVSWSAPAYTGTSSLTSYTIHSSGGATLSVGPTVLSAIIAGLTPVAHTFTVTATNSTGASILSAPSNTVTPLDGGTYNALTPSRILDTRSGNGGFPIRRVSAGGTLRLQVAGRGGVPVTGISAVVMNVTATNPTGAGIVTAYADGSSRPLASNLNYVAGLTVPNLVEVRVGTGGKVDLYVGGHSAHLLADVEGWVGDATDSFSAKGLYQPVPPSRILDTRNGNGAVKAKLGAGQSLILQVGGRGSVPATAVSAVVMNVTVTNPTAAGFLTVYPTGTARPVASNLNFVAGQAVPNRVTVAVGSSGRVTIFNAAGSVNVIADVNGFFTDATNAGGGAAYIARTPSRIADTRACACRLGPGYVLDLRFTGSLLMTAVVLNVTVTNTSSSGYLTVYPDDGSFGGGPAPLSSDLNYRAHQTVPNLTVVLVGTNLAFNVYNVGAWTDVVIDVEGYYGGIHFPPPPGLVMLHTDEFALPGGLRAPVRTPWPTTTVRLRTAA